MPNKLIQFWQELKRRKVTRTVTVYAAAAFVILELVSIIVEPLKLPEWTLPLIIVLLCVGFIITVIFSWVYDIHPEEGIVKTEPAHKVKTEDRTKTSNSWKIASHVSFVVIVGLIILNIFPRTGKKVILDKSIAVLPFRNDSPEQTEMYFIDGTMESILDNLCKIADLRVVSRTSVEQYRDNPKPIPTVGEEMNVSYVVEGSGLRHGDNIRLTIQLIDAVHDKHIWSNTYNRKSGEIFELQSEIAQLVAEEIEAIITPAEKALMEKVPTSNQTAWDLYQQGKDEQWKFWLKGDREALERAEKRFNKALGFDSTLALAKLGLAEVYWDIHSIDNIGSDAYLREEYLDTFLILVNTALSYDPQLSDAYRLRGDYFRMTGKPDQALEEYEKALQYNPNDWKAYRGKGNLFADRDYVMMIENMLKAASIYHGPELSDVYNSLWFSFFNAGFIDRANHYSQKVLELNNDTLWYYWRIYWTEHTLGNYSESLEIAKKSFAIDSNSNNCYHIAVAYMYLKRFEEALIYFRKAYGDFKDLDQLPPVAIDAIAGTLWKNGFIEESRHLFNEQLRILNQIVELGRDYTYYSYDFASIYAFLGEKDKAYENLRMFTQRETFNLFHVTIINNEFLFDGIRDEPEFQQIVRDVEAKYQAEHERVRQWLEENDMI